MYTRVQQKLPCSTFIPAGKRLKEAEICLATPSTCKNTSNSVDNGLSDNRNDADDQVQHHGLQLTRHPRHYETYITTSSGENLFTGQITATAYSALHQNGALLGLLCSVSTICKSTPVGPEVPEALQPTPLQLTVAHPPWIDRFPFPQMRDNMISLLGIIDEEEFLADLFGLTSFTIESGAASWDPSAWKIGREFSAKWGYLFY